VPAAGIEPAGTAQLAAGLMAGIVPGQFGLWPGTAAEGPGLLAGIVAD